MSNPTSAVFGPRPSDLWRLDPDSDVELDPTLLELSLQLASRLGIGTGEDLIHHLEDVDLGTDIDQERRELTADHPSADDRHPVRPARPVEGVVGADDARPVEVVSRDCPGMGARGEDHRATLDLPPTVIGLDLHPARAGEPAVATDHLDALRLEQPTQTPNQAFHGLVLPRQRRLPVECRLVGDDPELGGVGHGAEDLGDVEPLLGGDATPDQTGPAGALLVDQGHREPEVVGVERGGVSTGAPSHYDDVLQPSAFRTDCCSEPSCARRYPLRNPCRHAGSSSPRPRSPSSSSSPPPSGS